MKIDIIGSVASGKTTLAKNISKKYGVPYYEKDNIVWERTANGDKRRDPEERDRIFDSIIKKDDWIVEGSPRKNLQESFETCDHIIVLDIGTHIRLYRVFKRWILQRSGKIPYNAKPTVKFLLCNIKWVFEYDNMKKELMKSLSGYGEKCRVFRDSAQALQFIDDNF
ncbi:MAG: DNA topology modulation protein FlaR [Oscillospiraceae bacterium]|nr:DNA topology modulation protein FlaR [Oscillospiraceae bacterium]